MRTYSLHFAVLVVVAACLSFVASPAQAAAWDHIHLVADDTMAAAEWYAEHFGGEITKSGPFDAVLFDGKLVKFRRNPEETKGSEDSAVDHIAFSVPSVEEKKAALEEAGIKLGAPNRRTSTVALLEDPWGTKIELIEDEDLLGFHHVHLMSQQPKKLVEWYLEAFGGSAEPYKGIVHLDSIKYDDMWVFIQRSIRPVPGTKNRSVDHLGWLLDDFDATVAQLRDRGTTFVVEPQPSGDHRIAFILGPDDVKIELVSKPGE